MSARVSLPRILLREVPALASGDPGETAYMRLQARQAGPDAAPPRREPVALDDISPWLVCAVVRAEDPGFFHHHGIAWTFLRRAVVSALRGRRTGGASTITQQLARNLYLGPERSMSRKLREMAIARRMEAVLPKRRILELYLNAAEWGEGVWGAQAASRTYFGKAVAELGLLESLVLASLLPAPRRPLRGPNGERARRSQQNLIHQMVRSGLLHDDEGRWTWHQVVVLHRQLEDGRPLGDAVRAIDSMPRPALRSLPPLTVAGLIADGCGYARDPLANRPRRTAADAPDRSRPAQPAP